MSLTEQDILEYIAAHPHTHKSDIQHAVAKKISTVTLWRILKKLVDEGKLEVTGKGRATNYTLAGSGIIHAHLQTPYNLRKIVAYNNKFIDQYIPNKTFYLSKEERKQLREAGQPEYLLPAGSYIHQIIEKLLVDLSWASSRLEGNTYNILETEQLVRFGQEAQGKDRTEAIMILNHKEAIQYIVDHLAEVTISRRDICNIHALLANGLLIDPGMTGRIRRMPVGIWHSSYRPLTDHPVIEEEFEIIIQKAAAITDPFEQSFFLLVHIPYLQAFDDVNKRTSRIASNIPLLKADLAPLSFLTINDQEYINGLIGVYELNNISLLREIYIDAYVSSAFKYRVFRAEIDRPEKPALVYREFVREAIRRCVLEWKAFIPEKIKKMAVSACIPKDDIPQLVSYISLEFQGLHEGNVIRYQLRPEDLAGIKK